MHRSLVLLSLILAAACHDRNEIVIFHAASLTRAFGELGEAFVARHPGTHVRVEVSGSQTAARKVAELGLRADVVASADAEVIDRILHPDFAAWTLQFATNELVLACGAHSRNVDEVTDSNWPEILVRPEVVLGLVDPDLGPIGYRTVMLWQLAGGTHGASELAATLRSRIAPEHVVSDEGTLLALLSSRVIDYAFVYRSTADEHHLKAVRLPDAYNLGSTAVSYARARVRVRMRHAEDPVELSGAPIVYGLTIPTNAPNPDGAELFVTDLLGEAGQRILTRTGFRSLVRCDRAQALPARLRGLVR